MQVKTILAAVALALVAGAAGATASGLQAYWMNPSSSKFQVWADPSTGCEYLVYATYKQGGITPRMRANGTQICGRPRQ